MKISDHFSFKKLMLFVLPSILMMVFVSIYSVVDGFFISNFVGETEFASVNLVMSLPLILGSIGFLVGSGGSALISKTIGEGEKEKANEIFSMIIYFAILVGVVLGIIAFLFIEKIVILLGAEGDMIKYASTYGSILLVTLPFFILQYAFQALLVTAEKPKMGLYVTLIAGCSNILLDAVFVIVFKWGLVGAAIATSFSQVLGGLIPLIYFLRKNNSLLRLGKMNLDIKSLLKICANGSSEFVSNVSTAIVSIVFNLQLMKYYGEYGVASYGVYMYVSMIFIAVFLGFTTGVAPLVGYNYGSKNQEELKGLFSKSIIFIISSSVLMTIIGVALSKPLSSIFVSYNNELLDLTVHVMMIACLSFLFTGISIYASGFFTALNNGLISAIISFVRTLVCQLGAIILLPLIFKEEGIWYAIVTSEIIASVVSIFFIIFNKKEYNYY